MLVLRNSRGIWPTCFTLLQGEKIQHLHLYLPKSAIVCSSFINSQRIIWHSCNCLVTHCCNENVIFDFVLYIPKPSWYISLNCAELRWMYKLWIRTVYHPSSGSCSHVIKRLLSWTLQHGGSFIYSIVISTEMSHRPKLVGLFSCANLLSAVRAGEQQPFFLHALLCDTISLCASPKDSHGILHLPPCIPILGWLAL